MAVDPTITRTQSEKESKQAWPSAIFLPQFLFREITSGAALV